jgi:hypothetical protein
MNRPAAATALALILLTPAAAFAAPSPTDEAFTAKVS